MTEQITTAMHLLNPLTMPLTGRSVIEASAGTGKTFTITTLYVRLLLGLDEGNLPPLTVDQLLVMTFTEAATEEIRDRVRTRLQDVKNALLVTRDIHAHHGGSVFSSDLETYIEEPILRDILAQIKEPSVAFGRIDAALKSLDEAAIFTIHGFCHRMLQQHAFESRSLFEETFIMDETELLQRVTRDYWRRQVPQQQGLVLEVLQATWQHPDLLLRAVRGLLSRQFESILPEISWESTLSKVDAVVALIQKIKTLWLASDIESLLADSDLKANAKAKKSEHLLAMQAFCESTTLRPGKLDIKAWSVEALSKPSMLKGQKRVPQHPVFEHISDFLQASDSVEEDIRAAFLQQALAEIIQRREAEKQRLQYISPDDLLTRLANALSNDEQGLLASAIRKQFPAMMIDEFQDTDPLQYQIVDHIYPADLLTSDQSTDEQSLPVSDMKQDVSDTNVFSLIMIGDPKQAIYGFRGADIFTYIDAKRAVTAAKRFTLGTNWRSSAPMISAVNQLFNGANQGFLYQNDIPFQPVQAANADKHEQCVIADKTAASMHVWQIASPDGPMTQTQCKALITEQLVAEIVKLLAQGDASQAHIKGKPLVASDMAVLVRDRNEAKLVRESLRQAGIGSVFITRQSVFDSDFALDLYHLLVAVYQEKNERSIRSLLVGPFFGFSVQQVLQLNDDESQWQQLLQQIQRWKHQWLRFGVLAMLQQILIDNDLASVWRNKAWDVERLLTDYRHLGELLQEKSMQVEGPHRLLNWYRQQLSSEQQSDGFRLRLESDEKLVQIVTWHASKGLEYPVVFLPFAVNYRESKDVIFHQDKGLVLDLSPNSPFQTDAQKEQLAEDIRLLYVALTRPVYRCYVGVYDVKYGRTKRSVLPLTAMGCLLNLDPDMAEQYEALSENLLTWQTHVNNHFPNAFNIEVLDPTADSQSDSTSKTQDSSQPYDNAKQSVDSGQQNALRSAERHLEQCGELHARTFTGQIHRDWHVTSYSALSHNAASTHIQPGGTDEKSASRISAITEVNSPQDTTAQSFAEQQILAVAQHSSESFLPNDEQHALTVANFPKGANAGSCLHYIMESIDFTQAAQQLPEVVESALATYGIDEQWQPVALQWMQDVIDTPLLSEATFAALFNERAVTLEQLPTLGKIAEQQRLVEMEFFLPMQRVTASALTRIVQQHLREISVKSSNQHESLGGNTKTESPTETESYNQMPQLHFSPVQGVLKGFIDLLFCYQGKYFVLDYKSNWLGEGFADYHQRAMHDAMLSHHYHLQYLLYVLALHRFLAQRIPDYDYDVHIGGVVYAFLRGMQGANQEQTETLSINNGLYYQRPSKSIIEQLDELFAGEASKMTNKSAKRSTKTKTKQSAADKDQMSLWDDQNAEQWQQQDEE